MHTKLTKENCGEEISVEEAKQIMIEMLEKLADVCETNGIRYYLEGGTLIGAARHKGFIPWDDDIDVAIPKPDCVKLKQITGGKIGKYRLGDPMEKEYEFAECWRLYNDDYVVYSKDSGFYKPLFLDIEPYVGFPDDDKVMMHNFKRLRFWRVLMLTSVGPVWHGSNLKARIVHLLLRPITAILTYDRIFNKIESIKDTYKFEEMEYVGNMSSRVYTWQGKVRREDYTSPNHLEFEGRMYSVPGNFVEYLEVPYGKNCTTELPPPEKRVSVHNEVIYRFKE